MTNTEQVNAIKEKIAYQKAIYRFHETDDEALKAHFRGIIKAYEAKHNPKPANDPRQMLLPGFKQFDGRGLA